MRFVHRGSVGQASHGIVEAYTAVARCFNDAEDALLIFVAVAHGIVDVEIGAQLIWFDI